MPKPKDKLEKYIKRKNKILKSDLPSGIKVIVQDLLTEETFFSAKDIKHYYIKDEGEKYGMKPSTYERHEKSLIDIGLLTKTYHGSRSHPNIVTIHSEILDKDENIDIIVEKLNSHRQKRREDMRKVYEHSKNAPRSSRYKSSATHNPKSKKE